MDPTLPVSQERPTLLTLPLEIQDMICNLAYPRHPHFTVVTREAWEDEAKKNRRMSRATCTTEAFPLLYVDSLMVSKSYFVSAAKAHMGNQSIIISPRGLYQSYHTFSNKGIGAAFAKELKVLATSFTIWNRLRSIQNLTIVVSASSFENASLDPWDVLLTADEFLEIHGIQNILRLRGLRHVNLETSDSDLYIHTRQQQAMWDSNMERLKDMIKLHVCAPTDFDQDATCSNGVRATDALYPGSAVRFNGSKLLPHGVLPATSVSRSVSRFRVENVSARGASEALQDKDIPDSLDAFKRLLIDKGDKVMKWLRDAKAARK